MRIRGASLGVVMSVIALGLMLVLLAGSVAISNLRMASHLEARAQAENLAEGALHQAIGEILARDDFGLTGQTVEVPSSAIPGAHGVLTFSPSTAATLGLCRSTNNLAMEGATPGACRMVPGHMAHLVARGECNGVTAEKECLLARPPFPKGVSASGKVTADGLSVAGMRDPTLPPQGSNLVPANLSCNSSANPAIDLGTGCHIYGSVSCPGQVLTTPDVVIEGEVRAGAPEQELPALDLDALIGVVRSSPMAVTVGPSLPPGQLKYFNYAPAGVSVPGNLVLDGAVLAVNGDLEITGRVEGRGALLVTGKTTIAGGTDMRASDELALVSRGDVVLSGRSRDGYFFSGLLYGEGNVSISNLTLFGTVVANGPADLGNVTLSNVRMFQTPASVSLRAFKTMEFRSGDYGLLYVLSSLGPDGLPRYSARAYYKCMGDRPPWDYSYSQDQMTIGQLQQFIVTWGNSDGGEADDLLDTDLFTFVNNVISAPPQSLPGSVLEFELNNILSPAQRTRIVLMRPHHS